MQYWLGKDKKRKIQQTKMKVTSQNWIRPDIVGIVVGGSPRFIKVDPVKRKNIGTRTETPKKLW